MSEAPVDWLFPRQQQILDAITDRLDGFDVPVCRAFLAPGAQVPWDTCCECGSGSEGQAWVAVERMYPANGLDQDASAQRCHPNGYAADLVAGILRCAHTVDDQGVAPEAAVVTGDAAKVARDRKILRDALLCGFVGEDGEPGEFRLGFWQPLGPGGGCVGGSWTATIAIPACRCAEIPEASGFGQGPFGTTEFGG